MKHEQKYSRLLSTAKIEIEKERLHINMCIILQQNYYAIREQDTFIVSVYAKRGMNEHEIIYATGLLYFCLLDVKKNKQTGHCLLFHKEAFNSKNDSLQKKNFIHVSKKNPCFKPNDFDLNQMHSRIFLEISSS